MTKQKQTLSPQEVRHVADLAQLKLKRGEVEKFSKQLSDVFEYVNQIAEVETDTVAETSQVTGASIHFREDKINRKNMLSQEEALSGAKQTHNGYFVIKAIFSEEDGTS